MNLLRLLPAALALVIVSNFVYGQSAKRSLEITDLPGWKTVESATVSNDGNYVAYELNPLKGDGKLIVTATSQNFSDTIPLGKSARFTADSRYLVYRIDIPADSLKAARKKKLAKEKMPLGHIGIYDLGKGSSIQFDQVQSFKFAENQAPVLAFAQRPDSVTLLKDKSWLTDLVFFNLQTSDTTVFHKVQSFNVDKEGNAFIFQTNSADSASQVQLFRYNNATQKADLLFSSTGSIKNLELNNGGDTYAFLFSSDTTKQKKYGLYLGSAKSKAESVIKAEELTKGWYPSDNRPLQFSDNNKQLYFGTAPIVDQDSTEITPDDEKPLVDVWSWTDKELMPAQLVKRNKELKRTYLAVFNLNEKRTVQLADSIIPEVVFNPKAPGKLLLGENPSPYQRESSWTGRDAKDYYSIDPLTGTRKLIVSNETGVRMSPNENYAIWFEPADSAFYVIDLKADSAKPLNLTSSLPVAFYNEQQDIPDEANPYGIAGWAKDDRFVYLYDRFDIWQFDPSGKTKPVNITLGYGRQSKTNFRYIRTNPDELTVDTSNWLLSGFNETDKSAGFFSLNLKANTNPHSLISGDYVFNFVRKAKNADVLVWTRESCTDFPDLWTSSLQFKHPKKLTTTNPQQKDFIWVNRELVSWTSFSGEKLEGILYFPENFNPDSIYPMIVYYYELNSSTLNSYSVPSPSRSIINRSYYPSNGYLVFVPDITYQTGYPGQSAYNAIVSGTNTLLNERKYIDPKRVGIQGQSWGGYQTAYLVTQTDLFTAAMAGAPVSNMTSAYGGIRWESGMSRMFQYEHSQSRIGGTLWDKPMRYIENSPVFYAPKVNTPLLIMHNDHDGAVPWYQGIELFVSLRRLNKPVWLLNYNNEPHNLKAESWADRIDLTQRMMQFFDHYLKGAPAPMWMTEGVPATEKGRSLGY